MANETASSSAIDKGKLKDRLAAMKVAEGVFPTGRLEGDAVRSVTEGLAKGEHDRADAAVRRTLSGTKLAPEVKDGAFSSFAHTDAMREQLEGFAGAGLGFIIGGASYGRMSLRERAGMGGNSAVTRVLVSGERLLLETPRLNIRFRAEASEDERKSILKTFGLIQIGSFKFAPGLVQVISEQLPAQEVAVALLGYGAVEHAAPDFIEHIGQRYIPNDPDYGQQWHFQNIRAETAWDTTRGAGKRIAVVDNGFDKGHPDLAFGPSSAWYRSAGDLADADFVGGIAGMPPGNHGTACAGMATGISGNGRGGCGVAFESELMAVACLNDQVGPQSTLARAIAYAADPRTETDSPLGSDAGADVIACSLGPNGASWPMAPVLADAITFATSRGRGGLGTPVLWATTNGNYPINLDEVSSHASVIAVGRSTEGDGDNGSGFGPELALLAPGVNVYIPSQGGGYRVTTGTSFACPCSAGVAGLILAANPALSASDVRDILRKACDKVGSLPYNAQGRNNRFGHGRVNAELAVTLARSHIPAPNEFPGV